jgi:hypothetical protein
MMILGCSEDTRVEPKDKVEVLMSKHGLTLSKNPKSSTSLRFKSVEEADEFLTKLHASLDKRSKIAKIDLSSGKFLPENKNIKHDPSGAARSSFDDGPDGNFGDGYSSCFYRATEYVDNLSVICMLRADMVVTYDCRGLMGSSGGGGNDPSIPYSTGKLMVHAVDFGVDTRGVCLGIGWNPRRQLSGYTYTSNNSINVNWYVLGDISLTLFIEGVGDIMDYREIEASGSTPIYISL